MSAALTLDSDDLVSLARTLDELTATTQEHGVRLDFYGPVTVGIAGHPIQIRWDADRSGGGAYIVDDRVGS